MENRDEFDKILESVGDNGKYQRLLVFGFYLFLSIIMPWMALVQIFVATVPDHWCHVEGKPTDFSIDEWKNLTLPWDEVDGVQKQSKCQRYESFNLTQTQRDQNSSLIECRDGWEYDLTWYDSTLSSGNDWVCDDSGKAAAWLSAGQAGSPIGMLIFGYLSDNLGRKKIVFFLSQLFAVMSLLRIAFPSGWLSYLVMFLSFLPFPAIFQISFIWVSEQVNIEWRGYVTMLSFVVWTTGMCFLPLLAWLSRSWIYLTIATSIPVFCCLLFWPYTEESPRWLASRGKTSESLAVLQSISKKNKKKAIDLEEWFQGYMMERRSLVEEDVRLLNLVHSVHVRNWTILTIICFCSNLCIYYGLTYNVSNLGGNQFINFFLLAIVELPATFLAWILCQTIGRKLSQLLFFLCTFIVVICPIFFKDTEGVGTVICVILSKCLINGSFYAIYLISLELLPTSHRGVVFSIQSVTSNTLGIATPYIAYSSVYWTRLPYVVFGILAMIGFLSALFLPESMGHSLPQHIVDSEAYFKDQPLFSYQGKMPREWWKKMTRKTSTSGCQSDVGNTSL